jgi:TonB-linked SusC/RagA family outer membrane protein
MVGLIILMVGPLISPAFAGGSDPARNNVAFKQKPTIEPQPLTETIEALGRRYGVFFTYDVGLVTGREVDFTPIAEETLEVAIERLLVGTGLAYELFGDKYFVLYEDSQRGRRDANRLRRKVRQVDRLEQRSRTGLLRSDGQLQKTESTIDEITAGSQANGRVTDETGAPLMGVSIVVNGTSRGQLTDEEGRFQLSLTDDTEILQFSYLGFATQTLTVRRGSRLAVRMESVQNELPKVVIVGYGTINPVDATSSIVQVDAEEVPIGQAINAPHQWLQGKVAGVQVLGGNGEQGSFQSIRIRGSASMSASNEPLYVVDGMPVDNNPHVPTGLQPGRNPLNTLNPEDVARVTVLKDAAAGAIYGSRAANGVVLIETRQSKLYHKPKLKYSGWVSVARPTAKLAIHDAAGFRELVGDIAPWRLPELGEADTDWQSEILASALSQQHTLSYGAGNDRSAYRVSAGYLNRASIIKGADSDRLNISFNGRHNLFNRQLEITVDAKLGRVTDRLVSPTIFNYAYAFDPTQSVFEPGNRWGGYFEYQNDLTIKNPNGEADQVRDEERTFRLLAHLKANYTPAFAPHLKATLYLGTDVTNGRRSMFAPATVRYQFANQGEFRLARQQRRSHLAETYLNYDRRLAGGHLGLGLTAGHTYQHFVADFPWEHYLGIETTDYVFGQVPLSDRRSNNALFQENRLASFFGRGSFDWDHRYYLTTSFRTDGSSRFSPNNRWASFPAASVAWRLTEENFLANRPGWLNELKLRAGWGITGNQEIGDYQYLPTFSLGGNEVRFPFGNEYLVTARPNAISTDLKWEQTVSTTVALEAVFFDGRLRTVVEAYRSVTNDLLSRVVVPAGSNLSDVVLTNVGSIRNHGFELSTDLKLIDKRNVSWNVSFNLATNKNRVLSLGPAPDREFRAISTGAISGGRGNTIQIYREGEPLNAFYVFAHKRDRNGRPLIDGIDHNGDGRVNLADIYEDTDGNGQVNDRDKRAFHQPAPTLFGGLQSSLHVKRWGLHASLRAQTGNYVYNNLAAVSESYDRILSAPELLNVPIDIRESGFRSQQLFSDYFIEDASFLRMDALTVDYALPKNDKAPAGRLYLTLQNVFTLTAYRGLDPEIGNVSGNPDVPRYGIDDLIFPRSRSVVAGFSIDF